jgi:Adenylate and Guanylate cyclase catalytic domain
MESTGQPGCIHVSEQTAHELRAQGKHQWLKPRKGHVTAKGLGELTTYWIEIPSSTSSAGTRRGSVTSAAVECSHHHHHPNEEFNLFQQDTMAAVDFGLGRKLQRLECRLSVAESDIDDAESFDAPSRFYDNYSVHC